MANDEPWYSVRVVLQSSDGGTFEERITLWHAASLNEALAKGEAEATRYADDRGYRLTGFVEAFHLYSKDLVEGTELFSLLRDSDLPSDDYIARFFSSGGERRR